MESRGDSYGSLLYLDLHGESREIRGDLVQALFFTFFEVDIIWGVVQVDPCTSLMLIYLFLCKYEAQQRLEEELVTAL